MLEVCASKIGDIILSVLESKMENKLDEVKKAKIISDTRKSICEFEEKYLQNHDGTVLTSREFGEYLQYSKPIEEIFSTIWDTSTEIAGTTEIVEKLSTQCIESIKEKGRTIPPTENHLIKHFFEASVEIVSKMAREAITPGERMTQMQIKDLRNDMDGKLADIQAQLNQRERLSPEEEESIFDALYTILCGGEVHQIQKLVPLFQKKSDSIELALSVLIQLMAGEGNSPEVIVESIQKIENCYVRNIVIRFIIAYGFLWKEVVGEISSSSVDLKFKKIAGDLYTENWDKIFELKRDEKEYRVVLLVKKEYREEIWLGKRILFWYLNRFRDKCVIGLDDDLFTQPITIYDEMLLAWGKTHLICFMAKCKFEKILSDEIISVLIQKFDEVESDEEREKCMTLWFEFFDVLDKKEDESKYKGLFVQNVLIALQAYLRKGGSEQEIRNLTRKPMIKVAICLLYNSKCIDLQYDEKRVLPTTEQEMGKNG